MTTVGLAASPSPAKPSDETTNPGWAPSLLRLCSRKLGRAGPGFLPPDSQIVNVQFLNGYVWGNSLYTNRRPVHRHTIKLHMFYF